MGRDCYAKIHVELDYDDPDITSAMGFALWLVGHMLDVEPYPDQRGRPFEAGSMVRLIFECDYSSDGDDDRLDIDLTRAENIDPIGWFPSVDLGPAWVQRHRKSIMDMLLWALPCWIEDETGARWPRRVTLLGDSPDEIAA